MKKSKKQAKRNSKRITKDLSVKDTTSVKGGASSLDAPLVFKFSSVAVKTS
jgi:hypothetical protein